MTRRINPKTGVVETQKDWVDKTFNTWSPEKDENGAITRVNTDTGKIETQKDWVDKTFDLWSTKD